MAEKLTPVDRQLKAMSRAICNSCEGDTADMDGIHNRYRWEDYLPEAIAARKAFLRYPPKAVALAAIWRGEIVSPENAMQDRYDAADDAISAAWKEADDLRDQLGAERAEHDRRVTELLTANNVDVERRRAAARELEAARKLLRDLAATHPIVASPIGADPTAARRAWDAMDAYLDSLPKDAAA